MQDIAISEGLNTFLDIGSSAIISAYCVDLQDGSPVEKSLYFMARDLMKPNFKFEYVHTSDGAMGLKITNLCNTKAQLVLEKGTVFVPEHKKNEIIGLPIIHEEKIDIPEGSEFFLQPLYVEPIVIDRFHKSLYQIFKTVIDAEKDFSDIYDACMRFLTDMGGKIPGNFFDYVHTFSVALDWVQGGFVFKEVFKDKITAQLNSSDPAVRENAEKELGKLLCIGFGIAAGMSISGIAGTAYLYLEVINKAIHLAEGDTEWASKSIYLDLTEWASKSIYPDLMEGIKEIKAFSEII